MKKLLAFTLVLILSLLPVTAFAAEEDSFTEVKDEIYADENGEYDHGFPETVEKDGKVYILSEVKFESNHDAEPERTVEKIAEVKKSEAKEPEQTIEKDGVTFELVPESVKKNEREEKRSVTVSDTRERDITAGEEAEEEIEVTVTDDETGEEVTAKIPYKESTVLRTEWMNDLVTEMSFYNYDADVFLFGNTVIQKNDAVPLTPDQYQIVMDYLGMNPANQRITGAAWRGDPYMNGDILTRTAVLTGETLHEIDTDTYEGEVELQPTIYISYEAEYVETGETLEKRHSAKATATYVFSRMIETETEKPTETETEAETEPEPEIPAKGFFSTPAAYVLTGVAAAAVLFVIILFIIMKRRKKDEPAES